MYSSLTYLVRTSKTDIPFFANPIRKFLIERDPTKRKELYQKIMSDMGRVNDACMEFKRKGCSLRVEGIFSITLNECPHNIDEMINVTSRLNYVFSEWGRRAVSTCAVAIPNHIYPGIVKANHMRFLAVIHPILKEVLDNNFVSFEQKELLAIIERLMAYNITGDSRNLIDKTFTLLGLRIALKERGIKRHWFNNKFII